MAPERSISPQPAQPRIRPRPGRARARIAVAVATGLSALAALAPAVAEPARAAGPQSQAQPRAESLAPVLTARPSSVAPGEVLTLSGRGFPPDTDLTVGAGPPNSSYDDIDRTTSDANGGVLHEVLLPHRAEPGQMVVFVIATDDWSAKAASNPVTITADALTPMAAAVN